MSEFLDELARSLAKPMPRRRALRILGVSIVAAAVPLSRPALRGAIAAPSGAARGCNYPEACSANMRRSKVCGCEFYEGCYKTCCDPDLEHCCLFDRGPQSPGNPPCEKQCCPKGTKCPEKWLDPCPCAAPCGIRNECCRPDERCCRSGANAAGVKHCYDPETHCCSPRVGVVPKHSIDDLANCPNRTSNKKPTKVNGCGPEGGWLSKIIPNSYGDANFKPACDEHDRCYGKCNADRDVCDKSLRRDIEKACDKAYPHHDDFFDHRGVCSSRSNKYYSAVHNLGKGPYETAQKEACDCCP